MIIYGESDFSSTSMSIDSIIHALLSKRPNKLVLLPELKSSKHPRFLYVVKTRIPVLRLSIEIFAEGSL